MNTYLISVLVANHPGVLQRIAGLFSRRGYNIDSLSVCETHEKELSRMTIVVRGDTYILNQIIRQLEKLEDVKQVLHLDMHKTIFHELLMIKIEATPQDRAEIIQAADVYRANVIDLAANSVILEITGDPSTINAFLALINKYRVLEMVRTGLTALERGNKTIKDYMEIEEENNNG